VGSINSRIRIVVQARDLKKKKKKKKKKGLSPVAEPLPSKLKALVLNSVPQNKQINKN
jgi:hypothetical protein